MHLETWISLAAVCVALASLIFSRRDAQSKKTVRELAELRRQIDSNKEEIGDLQADVERLERENRRLRAENYELMASVLGHQQHCAECRMNQRAGRTTPFDGTEGPR